MKSGWKNSNFRRAVSTILSIILVVCTVTLNDITVRAADVKDLLDVAVWQEEKTAAYVRTYYETGFNPEGHLDSAEGGIGKVLVSGWALDRDDPDKNLEYHVYIGGPAGDPDAEVYTGLRADQERTDVDEHPDYKGLGKYHGFSDWIETNKRGEQEVYVYAINVGGGNGNANTFLGSATVYIKTENKINFPYDELDLESGQCSTCSFTFQGDQIHNLSYSIDDDSICEATWGDVDWNNPKADLQITGKKAGRTKVNVSYLNIDYEKFYTQSFEVVVTANCSTVSCSKSSTELVMDHNNIDTISVDCSPFPPTCTFGIGYDGEVIMATWARTQSAGILNIHIKALSPGKSKLNAYIYDQYGNVVGKGSIDVVVVQLVEQITFAEDSVSLYLTEKIKVTPVIEPSYASNKEVEWKSSDYDVATVDAAGNITAIGVGTAVITATAKDRRGVKADISVKVDPYIMSLEQSSIKLGVSKTAQLNLITPHDKAGFTWISENEKIAKVDSNGKVTGVSEGKTHIRVVAPGRSGYVRCKVIVESQTHKHSGSNVTYHAAVAPSCETVGNHPYYSCSCGRYFADEVCTQEIPENAWVIRASGHNYGDATYSWSADNKKMTAIKVCKNDANHKITQEVNSTYKVIKAATETTDGVGLYTATFSDLNFTTQTKKVVITKLSHTHGGDHATYHAAVPATCETAGNSAYYSCDCGKYFSDKLCTSEINKDSWVIKAKGHKYDKATYVWADDKTFVTGTRVCKNDANHTDTEQVTTTYQVINASTETATGIGRYTATFTKEGFTTQVKDVTIDKISHGHGGKNATYHAAVAATCETAGNSAYYSCSCGMYFSDEACTEKIKENSWVIKATGHDYGGATYKWPSDNLSVTGTRICKNDKNHKDIQKVTTTYTVIKEPTESETGTGKYTAAFTKEGFTTQTKKVTIPKLEPSSSKENVTKVFTDVPESEWYVPAVQFVYDNGIMNGISETAFGPKFVLTREQFITVLYNMEGAPDITFKQIFDDVKDEPGVWYAKSVTWASENKITSGIGNNLFGTGIEITREQLATLLYNYAGWKDEFKLSIDESVIADFPDVDQVSDWATTGMKWAVTNGVMGGKTGKDGKNILDPKGKATRAECAQMIKNLKEKAVK